MTKEALKLALEALHGFIPYLPLNDEAQCGRYDEAIIAIKQALAQPQQEPVAYGTWDTMLGKGHRMMMVRLDKGQDGCTVPLYTTPPQRKPQEFVCSTGLCHYRKPLTNDRAHQILLDMAKHIETFGDENITEQALSAECIRFILERVTAYGIKEEV